MRGLGGVALPLRGLIAPAADRTAAGEDDASCTSDLSNLSTARHAPALRDRLARTSPTFVGEVPDYVAALERRDPDRLRRLLDA